MKMRIRILFACCVSACALASPPPTVESTPSAEVIRDRSGVPHVYADTARALFFAAGYALAQDRLAQWELARRSARGRLAEILGPTMVDADRTARILDHTDEEWQKIVAQLPPDAHEIFMAYRDGMNQYIREVARDPSGKLPYEFKQWGISSVPWSVADYAATVAQSYVYYGTGGGGHELENLAFHDFLSSKFSAGEARTIFDDVLPLNDEDAVAIIRSSGAMPEALATGSPVAALSPQSLDSFLVLQAADEARRSVVHIRRGASRSVVIGPSRSASGHPLMLQSTADGPDVHLVGAGFDTAGFTLPASPVPIMGRGPTFGWLITTGEEDLIDTVAERLRPARPLEYWYKGRWRKMDVRTEVIRVRGARDVHLRVSRTVHGPVTLVDAAQSLAYSRQSAVWNYELDDVAANEKMARARTLTEFEVGVARLRGSFNVQYAGEDGVIAHWHAGRVPVRARGVDPRLPVPGTGEFEWHGLSSFAQWPKAMNPAERYFHVWNNKATPASSFGDSSRYGATFRTYLGRRLIESSDKLSVDDLKDINRKLGESAGGADLSLTSPQFFVKYLRQAVEGDARLTAAVASMAKWNGLYQDKDGDGYYDDPGLAVYRKWCAVAQGMIIGDVIGDWWHKIDDTKYIRYRTDLLYRAVAGSDARTALTFDWYRGRDKQRLLRDSVAKSVAELERQYKSADMNSWRQATYWKYYDDKAAARHPEHSPFPEEEQTGGSTAGQLGLVSDAVFNNGSEEWNALMEISSGTRSFLDVSPTGGQSQFIDIAGRGNSHLDDQIDKHVKFEFKKVPMTRREVEAESEGRITIKPP